MSTTTYRILQSTGCYPEVNTLLIALQGVAVAAELHVTGTVKYQPGDYLTVEAKHLKGEVRLPIVGPVEAALANKKPDEIHVTIINGSTPCTLKYSTSGFVEFINAIFLPFLVTYHERYRAELESKFKGGRTNWPSPWQMSWALRNAASHGGKVFEKATQQPVCWRGLTFSPSDEPAVKILSLVTGADILALMLEMEETRTGVPIARL